MPKTDKITFSSSGTLIEPNVHDCHLIGLFFSPNKDVLLVIRDDESHVFCLKLKGVERFCAAELKESMIILDITAQTGNDVTESDIKRVSGIEGAVSYEGYISKMMSKFQEHRLLFVQMNPSYGGTLECICNAIELEPEWKKLLAV